MAKVELNQLFQQQLRGELNGLIFYPGKDGEIIVRPKGKRARPISERQLAHHQRFRLAASYANQVKLDPVLAEEYRRLCAPHIGVYQAALRDFLIPPVIQRIDLQAFRGGAGEPIEITATDDCRVTRVEVLIRNKSNGTIVEQGAAAPSMVHNHWKYSVSNAIPAETAIVVEVTAFDRPGNQTIAEVNFYVPG